MNSDKRPDTPIPPKFRPGSPSADKWLGIKDQPIHKENPRITYAYYEKITKKQTAKQDKRATPPVPEFKAAELK